MGVRPGEEPPKSKKIVKKDGSEAKTSVPQPVLLTKTVKSTVSERKNRKIIKGII